MSNKTQPETKFDKIRWFIVLILLVLGIFANYYFSQEPVAIKIAVWIVLVCIILFVAAQTTKGAKAWRFLKEARNEIRRVVWPNRQETVQTTGMVMVMVVVVALILWGIDTILLMAIGWFTGHGG
jgi:preprotein translocase subunit SecE